MRIVKSPVAGAFRRVAGRLLQPAIGGLVGLLIASAPQTPSLARSGAAKVVRAPAHHAHPTRHHHGHVRPAAHRLHRTRHPALSKASPRAAVHVPGPVRASILVDADNGRVLHEENADARAYPASLTKLMTLYLTFEALNRRTLSLDQRLPVSAHAAAQEPTKLWLKPGDSVSVRSLILGLVTRSANDAAVVLAEAQADSEPAFAERMTATARRLGMKHTVYRNASGLPDRAQYTTARDLAQLALALYRDFPREYDYFSVRKFNFRGQEITSHNHLLDWYDGADGLKTGFIQASGFNLAASAERNDHRLVGVILGGSSWQARDRQMGALLDSGFRQLSAPAKVAAGDRVLPSDAAHEAKLHSMATLAEYLSPTSTAHAAPFAAREAPAQGRRTRPAAASSCSIQLGAFHARTAARHLAHKAARFPVAKGRTVRVVKDAAGHGHLYRVVVSHFTNTGARRACALLKSRVPCLVVE